MKEKMLKVKGSIGKEMQVVKGRARLVPASPRGVSSGPAGSPWAELTDKSRHMLCSC